MEKKRSLVTHYSETKADLNTIAEKVEHLRGSL